MIYNKKNKVTFAVVSLVCLLLQACTTLPDLTDVSCPETGYMRHASAVNYISTVDAYSDQNEEIYAQAKFLDIRGGCRFHENRVDVSIDVDVAVQYYQAEGQEQKDTRKPNVEYFIAIMNPQSEIMKKQVFSLDINVNQSGLALITEKLVQKIPMTDIKQAGEYKIIVGFQLTEDQLQYNKERGL